MDAARPNGRELALPARQLTATIDSVRSAASRHGVDSENVILGAAIGEWEHDLAWLEAVALKYSFSPDEEGRVRQLLEARHAGIWGAYSSLARSD